MSHGVNYSACPSETDPPKTPLLKARDITGCMFLGVIAGALLAAPDFHDFIFGVVAGGIAIILGAGLGLSIALTRELSR
jgi:hypothetical protein